MAKGNKKISLKGGKGCTALFLAPSEDGQELELLDYTYDYARIHKRCGGEYHELEGGKSVFGYIDGYADLTQVGYYRVDTKNLLWYPKQIADGVTIMFPYDGHRRNQRETLIKNPVVIKYYDTAIIYCNFYTTMKDVLISIFFKEQEQLEKGKQYMLRDFVDIKSKEKYTVSVGFIFYNMFGVCDYSPWEFFTEKLKNYEVRYPTEKVYKIFGISSCPDGTLVRTTKIGQKLFATEVLKKDPCELIKEQPAIPGWNLGKTNIIYKFLDKDVYIIGWELAENAFMKKAKRIAKKIGVDEDEFAGFVKGNLHKKYVTAERTVPKLLFFFEKEKILTQIYKTIAAEVSASVRKYAKDFIEELSVGRIL